MDDLLVIVPCGQAKVWDDEPDRGPTPAGEAYTGAPFKVNRAYAERHGDRWVILSARYGFIPPDFVLPGPYNVTFKKRATGPVDVATLIDQIREQGLHEFRRVIGLGGKEYRAAIEQVFAPFGRAVEFPFAGLPIGLAMQAIKRATGGSSPPTEKSGVPEHGTTLREGVRMPNKIQRRESVLRAVEEFDALGQECFLERYGFGPARSYFLALGGKLYDSKAIVGAAYGFENPTHGPLKKDKFVGGHATVRRWLEDLGFEVRVLEATTPEDDGPEGEGTDNGDDGRLARVNLTEKFALFHDHWSPKVVGELNGQHVKVVKIRGEFVWHKHDHEDELFLVIKGRFRMEFRSRQVWVEEGEFLVVPRGVEHRPVADEEAHVLLFEPATTLNTGDVRDERTVERPERI